MKNETIGSFKNENSEKSALINELQLKKIDNDAENRIERKVYAHLRSKLAPFLDKIKKQYPNYRIFLSQDNYVPTEFGKMTTPEIVIELRPFSFKNNDDLLNDINFNDLPKTEELLKFVSEIIKKKKIFGGLSSLVKVGKKGDASAEFDLEKHSVDLHNAGILPACVLTITNVQKYAGLAGFDGFSGSARTVSEYLKKKYGATMRLNEVPQVVKLIDKNKELKEKITKSSEEELTFRHREITEKIESILAENASRFSREISQILGW